MIFICLTPGPEGEHLKIIELESPPLGAGGGGLTFRSRLKINYPETWTSNPACLTCPAMEFSCLSEIFSSVSMGVSRAMV